MAWAIGSTGGLQQVEIHPGAQTSGHAPGQVWLTKNDTKEKKNNILLTLLRP